MAPACPVRGIRRRVNDPVHETTRPVTHQLLDYWEQHPEAEGTVESIVEWWLLEQRIQDAATEIRSVLNELVAKNLVVERRQGDGRLCYRLNRNSQGEARPRTESDGA